MNVLATVLPYDLHEVKHLRSLWLVHFFAQIKNNGVAGIRLMGSTNFTFEATIGSEEAEGEGNVGSLEGQQPIEVIIQSTSLAKFTDMRVESPNGER